MAKCPNCGTSLSCGCQKRTLSNGAQGCANCASKTVTKIATPIIKQENITPTVEGKRLVSSKNIWGKDRYNNITKIN